MGKETKSVPVATVTSKGQVTIPKPIRQMLKLTPGDRLDFVVEEKKVVIKRATFSIEELEGILHRPGRKPVSLETMERIIRTRARASR